MATLAENIDRGNAAIDASSPDEGDAVTMAMDAMIFVMHAGYSNALRETTDNMAEERQAEAVGAYVRPDLSEAAAFWDDLTARPRPHFLAEQAGEGSAADEANARACADATPISTWREARNGQEEHPEPAPLGQPRAQSRHARPRQLQRGAAARAGSEEGDAHR